jgi:uncharacterized protein YnzC (UPF0291/DUF896 family)
MGKRNRVCINFNAYFGDVVRRVFSEEDIKKNEKLREMYPHYTNQQLAKLLDLNISTVQKRAAKMGLSIQDKNMNSNLREENWKGNKPQVKIQIIGNKTIHRLL